MATKYPGLIDDNTSLPDAINNATPVEAVVVNRLKQAILSIETELGTKPSGIYSNVKARISAIEQSVNSLSNIVGNSKVTLRTDISNVQTTNATQTTVYSWTLTNNALTSVDVTIVAIHSTINDGARFKRGAEFINKAGAVSQINTTNDNGTNTSAGLTWDATIDFSGTTGRVRVTGATSTTIQWGAVVEIREIIA
jgi:hypothetical protein